MNLSSQAQFHLSIEVVVNGQVLIRRASACEVLLFERGKNPDSQLPKMAFLGISPRGTGRG
jgi:hypothetical protein